MMKQPESRPKPVSGGVRLSELAAVLNSLPCLSPEEAEAFAADIEEARREMRRLESPPEPPQSLTGE